MKPKILMVANDTTFIYKLRKEILEAFIESGYEVYIVAKKIKFLNELIEIGCKFTELKVPRNDTNPLSDINLLKKIYKIVKEIGPDMVFSNSIKPNVYFGIVCRRLGIPFIPNITGLGRALEYPGILQKISIVLYRFGLKSAHTVFFQNEFNRDFFIENKIIKKNQKYFILPGSGVNINEHRVLPYPESNILNFLFIARIRKEKGIDYFINSSKKIHEKYPNTSFSVCGLCEDDSYLNIFHELEKEGYFKYYGEQEDLTSFYQRANCIVHPTYYPEGMSNVLLEACAHGRPIITTDRPGCREIIDHGYNGYMIDTKNQKQLDLAIEKFINLRLQDKINMGIKGREKIKDYFNREIIVDEYLKLIKNK